jgi:lycopene cyclase CruA
MSTDRARGIVRAVGGDELLERLEHLDAHRGASSGRQPDGATAPPARGASTDFDVVMAGGGLWVILAPALASLGLRIAVVERARAGAVHREWNASEPELRPLHGPIGSAPALLSQAQVRSLVLNQYDYGICRWHGGGTYPVRGALDLAVDAGALLRLVRARAEDLGVTFIDGASVVATSAGPTAIRVGVRDASGTSELTARLLVDARGASSPHATADLVCPTVGGVLTGLQEGEGPQQMNPRVGDILVSTEGVVDGRQHIWEAFPGRPGETTVYLFYYALAERVPPGSLTALYARFFETLPTYKRGEATVVRPTFGYIPGWSRLPRRPAPEVARTVLVGDAAAQHSPLTFCGFGSMLRHFAPAALRIASLLDAEAAGAEVAPAGRFPPVIEGEAVHHGTGALARMMADPVTDPGRADELNELLDAAFASLHELGDGPYGALIRDEMSIDDFTSFLWRTSLKMPRVYQEVTKLLGPRFVARWGTGLASRWIRSRVGR